MQQYRPCLKIVFLSLFLLTLAPVLFAQDYLDPSKPIEVRVKDLISRMTLDEKYRQMGNSVPGIPRLGVPAYNYWSEALHGVARQGLATVFPQADALGSTWDPVLLQQITTVVSIEARAKTNAGSQKNLTFWSPTINLLRDPRWGREEEGYSEDPYLTGRMAVGFIKGMQGDDPKYLRTVSTIKHFAANNSEFNRHRGSSDMDERDLREYYLAAFKAGVVDGHVQSLMGAYNALNRVPCCASKELMTDILRGEWGFDGFTVSDCGAIADIYTGHRFAKTSQEAAAMGVKAGTDINCGGVYQSSLKRALEQGLIAESDIDLALFRAFRARFRLGEFDPDSMVTYRSIPISELDSQAHRDLALLAAKKAIVLLKNDKGILPLDAKSLKSIAVIGPNANRAIFGGYSGTPSFSVSPLDGIRNKLKAPQHAFIRIKAESFSDQSGIKTGPCREGGRNVGYVNEGDWVKFAAIDFADGCSGVEVRVASQSKGGTMEFRLDGLTGPKIASVVVQSTGNWQKWVTLSAAAGPAAGIHDLYIKFYGTGFDDLINLNWFEFKPVNPNYRAALNSGGVVVDYVEGCTVGGRDESGIAAAAALAEKADAAVVVVGTDLTVSDEERDRSNIGLPGVQEKLVQAVYAANPKTVVVLVNGPRLEINWIQENAPGILCAWYGGQSQGAAIADVLFGDYNPGGKLTTTWYKTLDDVPAIYKYDVREGNRTYWYYEGEPLYPFGHGLSYTTFAYSGLKLSARAAKAGAAVKVSLTLANTGTREGDEVVQLYIRNNDPAEKLPKKKLVGFERVTLKAGQKKTVTIPLAVNGETLGYWDASAHAFRLNPAAIDVMVGSSSGDIRLTGKLRVTSGGIDKAGGKK
ncbi:MAG: glycoside hydrolase family 3 C-terminal domain-containing protein [Spirochaetales bacterium]|nr:glycoside hydrolase family 3 C-terminal domain-containing protein [Spirochaetales bacterium]